MLELGKTWLGGIVLFALATTAWAADNYHTEAEQQEQPKLYSPFAKYTLKTSANQTPKATMLKSSAPKLALAAAINKVLGQSGKGVSVTLEQLILEPVPGNPKQIAVTLIAFGGESFSLEPISLAAVEAGGLVALRYSGTERFNQFPGGLVAAGTAAAWLRFYPETGDIVVQGLHGSVQVNWGLLSASDSTVVPPFRGIRVR